MAIAKTVTAQTDFSAGELNTEIKRNETHVLHKSGGREVENFRILHSQSLDQRPGRRLLFVYDGRVDEIEVAPGVIYRLCFGNDGGMEIRDSDGLVVATQPDATYAWRTDTLRDIVWTFVRSGALGVDVVITFPGQSMKRAIYTGTAWTFDEFVFQQDSQGHNLVPFLRIAAPAITMDPSASSGTITIVFSEDVLDVSVPSKHIGAQFRYASRRMLITAVADARHATAIVIDTLPPREVITTVQQLTGGYAVVVGDLVIGAQSGAEGIVTQLLSSTAFEVQIINNILSGFILFSPGVGENFATPSTRNTVADISNITFDPAAISVWDEQMISEARGWPQSCFTDQNRLGLCDLPGTPSGILWSWVTLPYNFDVGGTNGAIPTADYAIAELVPGRRRVYHVVPGPESSEFVFTDRGLYYVPINASNPLKPGSVAFQLITSDGCARIQPKVLEEVIIYVTAGLVSINAVLAPGAYYRPFQTRALTDFNNHLIKSPIALAVPTADGQYDERYFFVVNEDGSVAVAKVDVENGDVKPPIGWLPWTGSGHVKWMSVLGATVLFMSYYTEPDRLVVEQLDADVYLDSNMLVNVPPIAMAAPATKGPLWWMPSGTVTLMDAKRMMGTYDIDADGFIIPQGNAGEDLTSATLSAGQPWIAKFEPFITATPPGPDNLQRMRRRKIARTVVYVRDSSGFVFQILFAGPIRSGGPALGDVMSEHRIETWNQDDDPTQQPPLREQAYTFRSLGRYFDPRIRFLKDTPGPIQILEVDTEVTV